jgi:hypothetical protein
MARRFICPNCGFRGRSRRVTKGNFLIEIILWLFFIIPGLIYSIWRLGSRYSACPSCGAPYMVPINSPRGTKLSEEFKIKAPIATRRVSDKDRKRDRMALLLIVLVPIMFFLLYALFSRVISNYNKYTKKAELRAKQKEETPKESIPEAIDTNYQSELGYDGFRGIKWGTNSEEFSDMLFLSDDEGRALYQKSNENLKIDHVGVDKIVYIFYHKKFCGIGLEFSSVSNYQKLKDLLSASYGGYDKKEDLKGSEIQYAWAKDNMGVVMNFNLQSQKGRVFCVNDSLYQEKK